MIRQQEQNDILLDATQKFDELGIEYMLTGSMALVHYAIPRSTADIDIVLDIHPKHVDRFISKFEPTYLLGRQRIQDAIRMRRMFNILHQEVIIKVDCVVRKDDEFSRLAFSQRKRVNYTNDFQIWIISKEDLILSKLNWAKASRSDFQLRDVSTLLLGAYDDIYVQKWAEKLEIHDLFEEALRRSREDYAE